VSPLKTDIPQRARPQPTPKKSEHESSESSEAETATAASRTASLMRAPEKIGCHGHGVLDRNMLLEKRPIPSHGDVEDSLTVVPQNEIPASSVDTSGQLL
jgi:hypothetical protein